VLACGRVAVQVYGMSVTGTSGIPHRSIAVSSWLADRCRMARYVVRRPSCLRCPRATFLFAGIGPTSGQRRARVGAAPGECGSYRLRQAGGSATCPAESRTAVGQWDASGTRLDFMGHDPKDASR
jgi:hypothetical protein